MGGSRSAPRHAPGNEAVVSGLDLLRTEVQQLRAANQDADETRKSLTASVSRIMASRDHWQREAERLSALMAQVPPWSLLWWRCLRASKAWRKATARI